MGLVHTLMPHLNPSQPLTANGSPSLSPFFCYRKPWGLAEKSVPFSLGYILLYSLTSGGTAFMSQGLCIGSAGLASTWTSPVGFWFLTSSPGKACFCYFLLSTMGNT